MVVEALVGEMDALPRHVGEGGAHRCEDVGPRNGAAGSRRGHVGQLNHSVGGPALSSRANTMATATRIATAAASG